ncbi:hypothetical protein APF79_10090 [bacterium BRH_c32]|nr:MAG: hypothetical protein APF79_10090 [bacterium BRH_c32]
MKQLKKLVFELQKTQLPNYEECHNFLGFEKIEILEFNYDGKGNALVFEDEEISYMGPKCLRFLFFSGWYQLTEGGAN